MEREMNKMVWIYVDRWLRNLVEEEKPNLYTKSIEETWWNRIWSWWRSDHLPLYQKKLR